MGMVTNNDFCTITLFTFILNSYLKTMYEQTKQTSDLRLELAHQIIDLNLESNDLMLKFLQFLPQSQLEELKDSLDREMF